MFSIGVYISSSLKARIIALTMSFAVSLAMSIACPLLASISYARDFLILSLIELSSAKFSAISL